MPSREGSPNIKTQVKKELDALNEFLEKRGDKTVYYAVPITDKVQPTVLLPKGRVMSAYAFVMIDKNLVPHNLCPAIHPADLLYRLTEIRHTLERHLTPSEGTDD